jgi:pimeloyl-ACP methyl ester carboxylesterase
VVTHVDNAADIFRADDAGIAKLRETGQEVAPEHLVALARFQLAILQARPQLARKLQTAHRVVERIVSQIAAIDVRIHAFGRATEAGVDPKVTAVVYVAARAPDAGEDYSALASTFPPPPASAGIVFDGDEGRLTEAAFLRDFAGDLPETRARALYAVQQPFHKALLAGRTTHAAWRSKPSFYAVSTQDRTINPDLQRFMAKRMGATTIEVNASHLSLISHPEEIANLIVRAAAQA